MGIRWRRHRGEADAATQPSTGSIHGEAPTAPKDEMAAIVAVAAPILKEAGFRKRRHTFNRSSGDDRMVHVLNFQMGAYDPSGTAEIPGLRPNLYGRFTINLAVFVPAMHRMNLSSREWFSDYHCQLRKRIGELLPERADVWWRLDHRGAEADAVAAVRDTGLPWLDQFGSYDSLLQVWERGGGTAVGLNFPAAALDIADVHLSRGERDKAETLLADYVSQVHQTRQPGHLDILRKYLSERDFEDLAAQVPSAESWLDRRRSSQGDLE